MRVGFCSFIHVCFLHLISFGPISADIFVVFQVAPFTKPYLGTDPGGRGWRLDEGWVVSLTDADRHFLFFSVFYTLAHVLF